MRILRRAVPGDTYSEILASIAIRDPDPGIRLQAIEQLGRSQNKNALQSLRTITNDANRSPAERDSAKQSSAQVNANYEVIKPCDLNGDGRVNVLDVHAAVIQVTRGPCTTADLSKKGECTGEDVQRIVNATLGQPCVVTR